ncbi:WD repeat-containing protein 43 [Trichoplusia ni]|uniref:WD repeat-containing protein 43 n=1 Tax=Trichoplusia ni TaxID=7111 RepID=A0A7E5WTB8_TRINI|nr:WD repeat-containing protein 43 [Trichoplusia ni]
MAEAAFSDDGKYYSAITQDGRLRIWDTETNVLKQEYTPDLHLSAPPSCLQWISVTQSAGSPQKGSKRKSISEETHCIALGTRNGKILVYSIAQAKVETVLNDTKTNSSVTTLDWNRKYGLYSCNKDNNVYEWELNNSSIRYKYNINCDNKSKHGNNVSAIKIVPHNQSTNARFLVAASFQVRLWRLHEGDATLLKNLGHNAAPTAVLAVAAVNDVCWLIEGSQNERLLSFWDVTITEDHVPQLNGEETPYKRQRRKSISKTVTTMTQTYNFVLEDAPRILDVELKDDDGAVRLRLAATTRSGVVHYYGHMLNGSSLKPIKPSVTIQISSGDARPLPLQCCRLPPSGDLLLGYWHGPIMTFERVTPDLKSKTQILIRGEAKEPKKKVKQTQQANEVNKVKSEHDAKQVTYVEPMGGVVRKRATPGDTVEVPMEARLANLALDIKGRGKSAVSQNLTKLLMQGLHSKDKGIILTVLQKDDPLAALRTVSALPADYVPPLLEQLADMATRKTSQCASVCTWLSAVVRCHSALLLATMGSRSSDHLTQLLAIFTNRRSHLCQLLNLKGRLDLTISQRSSADIALNEEEPVLNYNDSSSDEMEAEAYQSDSGASWGDDKFDSDAEASAPDEEESDGD